MPKNSEWLLANHMNKQLTICLHWGNKRVCKNKLPRQEFTSIKTEKTLKDKDASKGNRISQRINCYALQRQCGSEQNKSVHEVMLQRIHN